MNNRAKEKGHEGRIAVVLPFLSFFSYYIPPQKLHHMSLVLYVDTVLT